MKIIKKIVLGFVVVSLLQSCMLMMLPEAIWSSNQEVKEKKENGNQESYASTNDSTNLIMTNIQI